MPVTVPDQWHYAVVGDSIVIPAPNDTSIIHVLTHLYAELINNSAVLVTPFVQVLDGATVVWSQEIASLQTPPPLDYQVIDTDLFAESTPGNSMTVQFTAAPPAGSIQQLRVTGYST